MYNEEYQDVTQVVLGVSGKQVGGILQETKQAQREYETSHGTHVNPLSFQTRINLIHSILCTIYIL